MNDKDLIVVLLDESGSMFSIRSETVESINTFINEQKLLDDGLFRLVKFSDPERVVNLFKNAKLSEAELTYADYYPNGMTALFDAICLTVDRVGAELAELDEKDRPKKVIFAIVTDGHENSSVQYTIEDVREKIKHQTDVYSWSFIFLGANMDAFSVGHGININQTVQWAATADGVRSMTTSLSHATTSLRKDVSSSADTE